MTSSTGSGINSGPLGGITPLLKTGALVVTILGAIPTAITAYNAYRFGVPFSQVSERLAQYDLLVKNIDCKIEYRAISTNQGTKIDAGACQSTGDISLKISTKDGKSAYQWIAYSELQKPGEPQPSAGLLDILIGAARAETRPGEVRLAQDALEVICRGPLSKTSFVRIVREGGKCYREQMSPVRGTVDKREEVPCDTKCPANG